MFPGSPSRPKYGSYGAAAGAGPPSTTASPTRGYQGHGSFYNGTTASPMQMSPFRASGGASGTGTGRSSLLNPRAASLKLNFGAPAPIGQAGVAGVGARTGAGSSGVHLHDAELLQSLSGDTGFGSSGTSGAGQGGVTRGGGGSRHGVSAATAPFRALPCLRACVCRTHTHIYHIFSPFHTAPNRTHTHTHTPRAAKPHHTTNNVLLRTTYNKNEIMKLSRNTPTRRNATQLRACSHAQHPHRSFSGVGVRRYSGHTGYPRLSKLGRGRWHDDAQPGTFVCLSLLRYNIWRYLPTYPRSTPSLSPSIFLHIYVCVYIYMCIVCVRYI